MDREGWRVIIVRELLRRSKPNIALLLVGVLIGALLIPPVAAHVGGTINHLWGAPNHLKKKVQTFSDARYHRFGGVLPKGKTQKGAWYGSDWGTGSSVGASISYPVPLNFNPEVKFIVVGDPTPPECGGTQANPSADPGYLCVFESFRLNLSPPDTYSPESGGPVCNLAPPTTPACRHGAILFAGKLNASNAAEMGGTWAVTAPTT